MSTATVERPADDGAATPLAVLAAAALTALYGAVTGVHVLGLLAGRGQFLVATGVQRIMPGFSLESSPVPVGAKPVADLLGRLSNVGADPWVLLGTVLLALFTAAGVLQLIHPGCLGRIRSRQVAGTRPVIALVVSCLTLLAAFWHLPAPMLDTVVPTLRAAMAGAVLWVLWHRWGWLHDEENVPSRLALLGRLLAGGAVGAAAHVAFQHYPMTDEAVALDGWLEAGLYSRDAWLQIAAHTIAFRAWCGLLVGALIGLLAPVGMGFYRRLNWVSPALILSILLVGAGDSWRQRVWVGRFDFGVPLTTSLTIPEGPGGEVEDRVLMVLEKPGTALVISRAPAESIVGLPLSITVREAIRQLLSRREERTCLARNASIHLHDEVTWQWDVDGALAIQLEQLQAPGALPVYGALALETLSHCARSATAEATLERLLDPEQYNWPNRDGLARLGRVCWRWGRLDAVADRLAEEAPEVLAELRREPSPGSDGVIEGTLRRGGEPWSGIRVGVIRYRWRRWLRAPVTRPWPQRLVSARTVTDEDGRFRLDGLFDDAYGLVVSVSLEKFGPLEMIEAVGGVGRITIEPDRRERDLGAIDIRPWRPGPPPVQAARPGTSPRGSRLGIATEVVAAAGSRHG